MKRTNKIIIAVMLIAIMLLGVGYAAIQNITLNITGTATADPSQSNFLVRFSGTPEVSDLSKVTAAITDDINATINVEGLTAAGDSVTATYTVQNVSTDLSADLSVETTNSNEEYFTIDADLGKTSLVAGEATTLTVTVELIKTPISEEETSTIGIQLTAEPVQPGEEGTTSGGNTGDTGTDYITAATLATEEAAALHYGGYVTNYTPTNGVNSTGTQWRIFHSDGTNIYLIADDYVDRTYVPVGKSGTAVGTSSTYARGFSLDACADYAGWSDISSSSIATKWLSQYVASGYTSTNDNMKATAYLLDTNQWSGFKDSSGYAEYAIGGPTLELFVASYNATHEPDIETQVSSENGYQVKWSTDTDYSYSISGLDTSEKLYVISDDTNAYGMWVASPSDHYTGGVMSVNYDGDVSRDTPYDPGYDARPCVVLNSNVKIEKQEDGTYKIVE